jgi:hypothetical protein
MFMSKDKFIRAYSNRKFDEPTIIIGDFMASALANIHSSLRVYRSLPTSISLGVLHQDSWSHRMLSNGAFNEYQLSKLIEDAANLENSLLEKRPIL